MEAQVSARRAKKLGGAVAKISGLPGEELTKLDPEEVFSTMQQLLDSARSTSPSQRLGLLLAADCLGEQLLLPGMNPPFAALKQKPDHLAGYNLTSRWDPLSTSRVYRHNLLKSL